MCIGTLLHARVAPWVFGCFDPKAGSAVLLFGVPRDTRLMHCLDVTGCVCEAECRRLLRRFFLASRQNRKMQS